MLIDSGVLLAAVSPRDSWHAVCRNLLGDVEKPLITTTAVATELFHFVRKDRWRKDLVWQLFSTGVVEVADIVQADMPLLEDLMRRYSDRPMDFADATLVHVAARERIHTILTIDHADFETYRIGRNTHFRIQPARDARRGGRA